MQAELDARLAALGARGHHTLIAGAIQGQRAVWSGWAAAPPAPEATSLFEIGSITKALTGILLADMSLRGEVGLDDPLGWHLGSLRPAWRHREPTLVELATHRSGLANVPKPLSQGELRYALGLSRRNPWTGVTASDYAELVAAESPRRPPGSAVGYSSMGIGLLGDALASRAGRPYAELLRERVLEPLGMTTTGVTSVAAGTARVVQGHSRRGRPRPPLIDLMPAAGSVHSSVEDMLRLLEHCLKPEDGPLGPALELARRPFARINRRLQIGLCWLIAAPKRRPAVVWHNGGTWGFRAFAGFTPDGGTAGVVMANTARGVDRLGFALAAGDPAGRARRPGRPTPR